MSNTLLTIFPKELEKQITLYTMFISNNRASFHLWWKENLVKHQKVSKYYEMIVNYCLSKENVKVEMRISDDHSVANTKGEIVSSY